LLLTLAITVAVGGCGKAASSTDFVKATVKCYYGPTHQTYVVVDPDQLEQLLSFFPQPDRVSRSEGTMLLKGDVFVTFVRADKTEVKVTASTFDPDREIWLPLDHKSNGWLPLQSGLRDFLSSLPAAE
jgi:hypothetical protein